MSIFAVTFYPSRKSDNHRGGIYWAVKLYTDTSSHLKSEIKIGKVSFKKGSMSSLIMSVQRNGSSPGARWGNVAGIMRMYLGLSLSPESQGVGSTAESSLG